MVAVPMSIAVTLPSVLTVATAVLLLFHVTFLFVASVGVTVAVSVLVEPFSRESVVGMTVTSITGTMTVTTQVAVFSPSTVVHVIVAVPSLIAVTTPLLLTAAKAVSIGVENSSTTIDMLRPVVWFEVRVYNHSDYPMLIDDISFSNFNPSTSYILPKDGTIPTSATYRSLPLYDTYTGGTDITVAAATESCVYLTPLFENRAPSYTMSLTAKVGSGGTETVKAINTSDSFMLKNRSTGRYLVDNGSGRLALVSSVNSAESQDHALWRFSGTSSGYMTNVATGKKYYRGTSSATSGNNLTFQVNNNGYLLIYYNRYYLRDNNGTANFGNTSNSTREWIIEKSGGKTASISNRQINIVDRQTAAVTPMTEQLRNQHIKIVINAYFNETDGKFNFTVLPWVEKNEETEFN
jgi:hypothetical protein